MSNYKYFLDKHDLKVNKITKVDDSIIVITPLGQFVFKDADINIYNYLLSRGFDYFPKIVDYNDTTIMFEYVENISCKFEQKAQDYIKLLSLLHFKTSYYKKTNIDEYKAIYEDIHNKLKDVINYYNSLINIIESKEYMSPAEYLVARNITNIFMLIDYGFKELEEWFKLVKNSNKKRVVTLYNKIDLNNMIEGINSSYLTDYNNLSEGLPIFDLCNFFKKYCLKIDFTSSINKYQKIFKLSNEELKLLFVLISIPEKIVIKNSINSISTIKNQIKKIYIIIDFLNSKEEKDTSTHQEEDNK